MVLQLLLGATVVVLLLHYALERRLIARFAHSAAGDAPCERRMDAALRLGSAVFSLVRACPDDPCFLPVPVLASLGATPGRVLRVGGTCSGKSRVAIVALRAMGIPAAQVTLYHSDGHAQHCVVEAKCRGGPVMFDPVYGLYFVNDGGQPVGLAALRAGQRPAFRGLAQGDPREYPRHEYFDFDYSNSRTANWTQSRARRTAYRVLTVLTRGRIDELRQPVFAEWPQLLLGVGFGFALIAAHLVAINVG